MGEIVNLRRVKKQRARDAAERQAAENRARHGQSAAERAARRKQDELAERKLRGADLTGDGEPRE